MPVMNVPTFQPQAHAGFSAVSYLFLDSETGIVNRDSLGSHDLIRPGGLHWATVDSGIMHESERVAERPFSRGMEAICVACFMRCLRNRPFSLCAGGLPPEIDARRYVPRQMQFEELNAISNRFPNTVVLPMHADVECSGDDAGQSLHPGGSRVASRQGVTSLPR